MFYITVLYLLLSYIDLSQSIGLCSSQGDSCGTITKGDCTGRKGAVLTCSDGVTQYGSGVDENCYCQNEGGTLAILACVNVKTEAVCPVEGDSCNTCTQMGAPMSTCPDGVKTYGNMGCTYQKDSANILTCQNNVVNKQDVCPDPSNPCDTVRCAGPGCCRAAMNSNGEPIADCLGNIYSTNSLGGQECVEISCSTFANCASYSDGCNTCDCVNGGGCTEMACDEYEDPACKKCMDGYGINSDGDCEISTTTTGCTNGEVSVDGVCQADPCGADENCATYYDGCNTFEDCDTDAIAQTTSLNCLGGGNFAQGVSECRKCINGYRVNDEGRCEAISCATFANCASYSDGCNTCDCGTSSGLAACTMIACDEYKLNSDGECTACVDGYKLNSDGECVGTGINNICTDGERLINGVCVIDPCGENCVRFDDGCNDCECASNECVTDNMCKQYLAPKCTNCGDYKVDEQGVCIIGGVTGFTCGDNCVTYTDGCNEGCDCETGLCTSDNVCIWQGIAKCTGCADGYEVDENDVCVAVQIVDGSCAVYGFEPDDAEETICNICFREITATGDRRRIATDAGNTRRLCTAIKKIAYSRRPLLSGGTEDDAECMLKYCQTQNRDLKDCAVEFIGIKDGIETLNEFITAENCNCDSFECTDGSTGDVGRLGVFIGMAVVVVIFAWME